MSSQTSVVSDKGATAISLKPIGWIRKQDGLEYAPVIVLYAAKPAPENGTEPVEMYSRDQVEHMLADQAAEIERLTACLKTANASAEEFERKSYLLGDQIEAQAAAPDLLEALRDMLDGWKYIRQSHGDLYGVGWDRAQDKAETAIARATGQP